jgi:hypothetical protein
LDAYEYKRTNGVNCIKYRLRIKGVTPEVFTMMVIMALVTTFMTGPALDLINFIFKSRTVNDDEEAINKISTAS